MKILSLAALATGALAVPVLAQPVPVPPQPPHAVPPIGHMAHHPMAVRNRAEVVAKLREHFAKLDANRDGFVTRAEVESGRAQNKEIRRERIVERVVSKGGPAMAHAPVDRRARFDQLDANKDGSISRQEFESAPAGGERRTVIVHRDGPSGRGAAAVIGPGGMRQRFIMRAGGMGLHGRMFDMADANRDNRISLQEATDAALRHFDTADLNRDGQLTPEERKQRRMRAWSERHPG